MIPTTLANYTLVNKPFFMPWIRTNLSYDALLGCAFTLDSTVNGKIYLCTYIKTSDKLIIGFDLCINGKESNIPIVRETINLSQGITLVNLSSDYEEFLGGTLTVIGTATTETLTDKPIQISPRFIYKDSGRAYKQITIKGDNTSIVTLGNNCNIQSNNLDLVYSNGTLNISYISENDTEIIDDTFQGIKTINGVSVVDETITIPLVANGMCTDVVPLNKNVASIYFDNYNICDQTQIYYEYFDPRVHSIEAPVDVCFTVPEYIFNPSRIDDIKFTHEQLKWYSMSNSTGDQYAE